MELQAQTLLLLGVPGVQLRQRLLVFWVCQSHPARGPAQAAVEVAAVTAPVVVMSPVVQLQACEPQRQQRMLMRTWGCRKTCEV